MARQPGSRTRWQVRLAASQRKQLKRTVRAHTAGQAAVLRARIALEAAGRLATERIARRLGMQPATVRKWRRRWCQRGLAGLADLPRPGRPRAFPQVVAAQVMTTEPYASARRVFWVVDNGSSHRGQAAVKRLEGKWHNLRLVHLPVHASWINQIEIYFSVVQRKVLTPNDFTDLGEVQQRLLGFQRRYEQTAEPFECYSECVLV
ncbi:MAG TPA: transposase [Actinomycetes bacterium]|nr:transposase [Actinomycetes bacterium]